MDTFALRFLADESCDFAVVRALRAVGYDVLAVSKVTRRSAGLCQSRRFRWRNPHSLPWQRARGTRTSCCAGCARAWESVAGLLRSRAARSRPH